MCAPCEQKLRVASKHFLAGAYISRAARDDIISVHTARHIIKHSIAESMCRQAGCAGEPNAICDEMSWEEPRQPGELCDVECICTQFVYYANRHTAACVQVLYSINWLSKPDMTWWPTSLNPLDPVMFMFWCTFRQGSQRFMNSICVCCMLCAPSLVQIVKVYGFVSKYPIQKIYKVTNIVSSSYKKNSRMLN